MHVPLLLGTNSYEAGFGPFPQMAKGLAERLSAQWPKIQAVYDGYGTHQTEEIEGELLTDMMFTVPTRRAARMAAQNGLPTYLYYYSYLPPSQRGRVPGPSHFDEVFAVFGTMGLREREWGAGTQPIVDEMQTRWVQFAKIGRPTEDGALWPALSSDADRLLEFTDSGPIVRSNYGRERLDLAEAISSAAPRQ